MGVFKFRLAFWKTCICHLKFDMFSTQELSDDIGCDSSMLSNEIHWHLENLWKH